MIHCICEDHGLGFTGVSVSIMRSGGVGTYQTQVSQSLLLLLVWSEYTITTVDLTTCTQSHADDFRMLLLV